MITSNQKNKVGELTRKQLAAALITVGLCVSILAVIGLLALVHRRRKQLDSKRGENSKLSIGLKDQLLDNVTVFKETRLQKCSNNRRAVGNLSRSGSSSDSGTFAGSKCLSGSRGGTHASEDHDADLGSSSDSDVLSPTHLGLLEFSVSYSGPQRLLQVTVVRCFDLLARDAAHGTADPFVKLQLLPDKKHRVKTNVVHKSLNPVFNETFSFANISSAQLANASLHFVVLTYDRYSRDEVIGEFVCPFDSLKMNTTNNSSLKEVNFVKEILPRELKLDQKGGRGDVLVSLCHQPMTNRLNVVILKARNLPKMSASNLPGDPYVRMCLYFKDDLIGKKKSHVKKHTTNPVYNEAFTFDLPAGEDLNNLRMDLQVIDWDRMTKSETLGRVLISHQTESTTAMKHWQNMIQNPCKQVAEWHPLQP